MKGSFLVKSKEEDVITDKGVRAFIMERLLNSPFQKASVSNIDNKTVEIKLEGDEKQIKEFMQNLQKALVAEFGNPTISFTPFEENQALEIPKLMRSSQALMVGQLQKGVNVQLDILGALKQMSGELKGMSKELKAMPREIGKVLGRQQ
jgi:acylphosphatase